MSQHSDDEILGNLAPTLDEASEGDFAFFRAYSEVRSEAQAEALRAQYCVLCRTNDGDELASRLAACQAARCELREPSAYTAERLWNAEVVLGFIDGWPPLESAIVAANRHIAEVGAVTMELVSYGDGSVGWDMAASTLRGAIHKALLRFCALLGGHPIAPALTDADAEGLRDYRRRKNIARVQMMAAVGMSQLAIVRATRFKRSTVQRWLKLPNPTGWGVWLRGEEPKGEWPDR